MSSSVPFSVFIVFLYWSTNSSISWFISFEISFPELLTFVSSTLSSISSSIMLIFAIIFFVEGFSSYFFILHYLCIDPSLSLSALCAILVLFYISSLPTSSVSLSDKISNQLGEWTETLSSCLILATFAGFF